MSTYFVRRLLLFIPTLLIVSMLVFLSVRLLPGDFVDILLSDPQYGATDDDLERFSEMLGLNVPAHIAYVQWMRGIVLEGTLGQSLLRGHKPVEIRILDRFPVTLELGVAALIIGLVIALPVGIYSAVRQDTLGDYAGRSVAIFGLATPNFWLALMVLIFPGIWWGWTPPLRLFDFSEDPLPVSDIADPGGADARRRRGPLADFLYRLVREKPLGLLGAVIIVLFVLVSVFADVLAPDPEQRQDVTRRLQGPSAAHLLGTDHTGRDFLSRNIYGARLSLLVGFAATTVAVVVATVVGGLSGFVGGRLDLLTQRFVDAWMAFPGLLLLMTIMSILGTGAPQIIVVLGLTYGIGSSRVIRGAVIAVKENAYFEAAQAVGSPSRRTVRRHVLPNVLAPIIIIFSITVGAVIITEASLSFLGFGLPLNVPSWGGLLSREGRNYMQQAPWLAMWPGIFLTVVVYSFNMFGDAVRDLLDPRLRGGAGRMGTHGGKPLR